MLQLTSGELAYMQAHSSDDRRSWFIGVNVACLALAYIAVGLRIASRKKIKSHIGVDDWLACVAALMVTIQVISLVISVKDGMGRHVDRVSDLKDFHIQSLVSQTFYYLCIGSTKFSILCLYGRIFRRTTGWLNPTLYLTGLFVFLLMIPQCFAIIFQCVPIKSLWTVLPDSYRVVCINLQAAIVAFGVIHIVTDWWILVLPVPVFLGLQLEWRAKWTICSLFLVGGVVCIASIVRLCYARSLDGSRDPTWEFVPVFVISTLESSVGILAACLPTWRPLFKFARSGITSYFSSSSPSSNDSTAPLSHGVNQERKSLFSRLLPKNSKPRTNHLNIGSPTGLHATHGLQIIGSKRTESSLSGSSLEKILKDTTTDNNTSRSSTLQLKTPKSAARIPSPTPAHSPQRAMILPWEYEEWSSKEPNESGQHTGCKYEAKAQVDRWEALQRGRGRSPVPFGQPRFGDLVYGQSSGNMAQAAEKTSGSGWDGIVVTSTATVTSTEDERRK